jgi:dihydroxyacid dehydratase/phosphogluconate dehydratase
LSESVVGGFGEEFSALEAQAIRAGDVAVLRGLGPVGGPGVASASWMASLHDKVHIAQAVNAARQSH